MSPPRRVIVDSNLLASPANRHFVGLLAETSGIVMCGTSESRVEDEVAIRHIMSDRHSGSALEEQIAVGVRRLDAWREDYGRAGLWELLPDAAVRPAAGAGRERRAMAERLWRSYVTDPRDEHLFAAAVACRLDALFTANMAMIEKEDWARILVRMGADSPTLCRRAWLVDWALGRPDTAKEPNTTAHMMVAAMTAAPDLKGAVTRWAKSIQGAFPEHSARAIKFLDSRSEPQVQALHADLSAAAGHPVTQNVLRSSMSSGPR